MKAKLETFQAYATVGRLLYEKILPLNRENNRDELLAYGNMADAFVHYESNEAETGTIDKAMDGFMLEISEWVGLKLDAPEMADEYGKSIKIGYAEVLRNL